MKIGPLDTKPVAAPSAAERKAEVGKATSSTDGRAAAPGASARVELSATAAALAGGVGEASIDQAKVDRISQAIRDGQFQVNADVIADKLIANAQDLLGKSGA